MLSEHVSVSGRTLSDPAAVDDSIALAVRHLLSLQSEEGYWWAELESNVTITAEHVFFRHIMNSTDPEEAIKAGRYILSQQREDGTWSNWHGGPADLSTTLEAYAALKMTGASPDAPSMEKARRYILSCGGIEKSRIFTKIWLAMMGEWPWRGIPILPPELMLLPKRFPVSIYSFGCWARQTIVALSVVMTLRPVVPLAPSLRLDELYAGGRENADVRVRDNKRTLLSTCFLIADRALRVLERSPWKPLRRISLRKAESWIIARQEADGSWGGIQPPWVYSLIALRSLGYGLEHPVIKRGIAGFYGPKGFAIEEDETFRMQSCLSPVWDTGLAMLALQDAGLSPAHPSLGSAGSWLIEQQITSGGDWQVRCGAAPGGWAFEFENDVYPDTDDTAMVALAIAASAVDEDAKRRALDRATAWLVGMQSSNGGWGAFDRNNTQTWTRHIPFADFGEMIDPPSIDVTAHILECLGRLGWPADHRVVRRGVGYIKKEQDADGSWYGRWGVNRIYGTGAVLPALQAIGEDMRSPYIQRAVSWLLDRQNLDGGWGEDIESYHHPRMRGRGPSTASQTGWALLALIAAGRAGDPAVMRGIEFLIQSQRKAGGWEEPHFTGTGFPTDFMIRYHIYRDVFPLMALGRYRAAREAVV
jgi:squalene-hopene/tetraprenyl-beta-curcumene cyclase